MEDESASESSPPETPKRKFGLREFVLVAIVAGIAALILIPLTPSVTPAEKVAYFSCKAFVEAQEIYRINTRHTDEIGQFASNMKEIGSIMDPSFLQAEGKPSH